MIKDQTTDTIYQVIMKHYHQPDISATEKQFYAYVLKCYFANPAVTTNLAEWCPLTKSEFQEYYDALRKELSGEKEKPEAKGNDYLSPYQVAGLVFLLVIVFIVIVIGCTCL